MKKLLQISILCILITMQIDAKTLETKSIKYLPIMFNNTTNIVPYSDTIKEITTSKPTNDTTLPPATHWVDGVNGDDSNNGTSEDTAWKTMPKAFATVTAGQTVYIKGGIYTGRCILAHSGTKDKRITIMAVPGEKVILDDKVETKMWYGTIHLEDKAYFTIDGIEVKHSGFYAIFARTGTHDFTIQNCKTYDSVSSGIYLYGYQKWVYNAIIKNNTVVFPNQGTSNTLPDGSKFGVQEAISIAKAHDFVIEGNDVSHGNKEGIDSKSGSYNGKITNNYIHDFPDKTPERLEAGEDLYPYVPGIYIDSGKNIEVANNKIRRVTYGIAISTEKNGLTKDINIHHNNMTGGAIKGQSKNDSGTMTIGIAFSWNDTYGKVSKYNYTISDNIIDAGTGISNGEKPEYLHNVTIQNNTFYGISDDFLRHRYGEPENLIVKGTILKSGHL